MMRLLALALVMGLAAGCGGSEGGDDDDNSSTGLLNVTPVTVTMTAGGGIGGGDLISADICYRDTIIDTPPDYYLEPAMGAGRCFGGLHYLTLGLDRDAGTYYVGAGYTVDNDGNPIATTVIESASAGTLDNQANHVNDVPMGSAVTITTLDFTVVIQFDGETVTVTSFTLAGG